jgi:hypothetical protein
MMNLLILADLRNNKLQMVDSNILQSSVWIKKFFVYGNKLSQNIYLNLSGLESFNLESLWGSDCSRWVFILIQ